MSDRRTVATDALATLGTIIGDYAMRDAIHLAVFPAVASQLLSPGESVSILDGLACRTQRGCGLGIVDPFLARPVKPGERFWLILYPRTIDSLRHVWSHPGIPDEPQTGPVVAATAENRVASEKWLREFCDSADCPGYEFVMDAIGDGSDLHDGNLHIGDDAHGSIPPEFWDHVEVVLGHKVSGRPTYFSCSC